jgi:hypothetical protein
MRHFWANVVGNQLVWLCAVVGAGHGLRWPAVLAAAAYVASQLWLSAQPGVELKLMVLAMACGLAVDGIAGATGAVSMPRMAPPGWHRCGFWRCGRRSR